VKPFRLGSDIIAAKSQTTKKPGPAIMHRDQRVMLDYKTLCFLSGYYQVILECFFRGSCVLSLYIVAAGSRAHGRCTFFVSSKESASRTVCPLQTAQEVPEPRHIANTSSRCASCARDSIGCPARSTLPNWRGSASRKGEVKRSCSQKQTTIGGVAIIYWPDEM